MRFWIKIVVALSVVVVVAFSVWAFFFKEKEEVMAYNKTAQLLDFKKSLALEERLNDLRNMNYLNNDKSKVITDSTSVSKDILHLRKVCLSTSLIKGYDDAGVEVYSYDSYYSSEKMADEILQNILPYMKGDKVIGKSRRQVTSAVDEYIKALRDVSESLDTLVLYQKHITGSEVEMQVLYGHYNGVSYKYRKALSCAGTLIYNATDYINSSVFRNEFKTDTYMAIYDAYGRTLSVSASVEKIQEIDFAHDLRLIADRLDKVRANQSIFTDEFSEYKFLTSYNLLLSEYNSTLNLVFSKKNIEKKRMASGVNLSEIVEKAQQSVVVITNVLGF